jgi:hypothetical protein
VQQRRLTNRTIDLDAVGERHTVDAGADTNSDANTNSDADTGAAE